MSRTRRPTPPKRPSKPEAPGRPDPGMSADVETLQTQLRLARAQNAYLNRELAALKQSTLAETTVDGDEEALRTAYTALRGQYAILTQHHADLQRRYEESNRREERLHKEIVEIWGNIQRGREWLRQSSLVEEPVNPAALLKNLLAIVHPDRWSQGQPASELAHELSVAINQLRERMGVQP